MHDAFLSAMNNRSHLPAEIRDMDGMSGQRYRSCINTLVTTTDNARYLEIGSWKGSTVCSALHGNSATAVCIDNWSEFGGPRDEFSRNVKDVRGRLRVIDRDFRSVDYGDIGTFNIYLFDGPHTDLDQYDGVVIPQPALAPRFTLIVDDWNWRDVRIGTLRGLYDARCGIEAAIEVRTTLDGSTPAITGKHSEWHNGHLFAVVKRYLA
jgi:hypothetical protein